MKNKFYFLNQDSENCFSKEYFLNYAKENNLQELTLFEAVKEKVQGFFYCKELESAGEEGSCGKICEGYAPKNGKSGMCKHKTNFHTPGKKIIIKM